MIREYAPIPLIPAAWLLTFSTVVYPGLSTYWIRHMHYFMLIFLGLFAVLSWREMDEPVMKTWRNIIAAGFFFTALGTAGFHINNYQNFLFLAALKYWFIAPVYGFEVTSRNLDKYSDEYRYLRDLGAVFALIFIAGLYVKTDLIIGAAFIGTALVQAASILMASKLDI